MGSFIVILVFIAGFSVFYASQRKKKVVHDEFPVAWRNILDLRVVFYHNLVAADKVRFEHDVMRFIANVRITGVKTDIDITDKLLVASSAVIPVFGFPEWDYTFLDEVLLYPGSFDRHYAMEDKEEVITGMVGSGTMEGKMILSKQALHNGFDNTTDKQNVGIHEFIHLLDKEDGVIDGIPATLKGKDYAMPWIDLIKNKSREIMKGSSDINEYGATKETEFLAVVGEYFFERPQLLKKNHPDLYALLSRAFQQDTASTIKTHPKKEQVERNDDCPCGSGKKFKKCCMNSNS
jgi:Mlc titration factor MtfA (ptsG expression regulator)